MALRQNPIRLLIADDVGVGKTIEAGLIARELWDRGEIERLAVLCPPYLCDQWQRELSEKFNLPAVVVNSSTLAQLERAKPDSIHLYEYYRMLVISIDWVKSERHRHLFLQMCPELVIVDEVHNAVPASTPAQQRYELVSKLAQNPQRHLILLTATPHSGIPDAFQKLLTLLNPQFANWTFSALTEAQRDQLARHFVLRTRGDIEKDWGAQACFPKREVIDATYRLSPLARKLFVETYDYCLQMLPASGQLPSERSQRARYWAALALLRSVMSSPEAALQAIQNRRNALQELQNLLGTEETDELTRDYVEDPSLRLSEDEAPSIALEMAELSQSEQNRLRDIARIARQILEQRADTKVEGCIQLVQDLLRKNFMPIVWCRFITTAEYVACCLREALTPEFPELQIVCLTGRQSDEERRMQVDALSADAPRVLVATDCLAEGINLQSKFNAVIHYDLPWNPNKLEQREGRVDRFGQQSPTVRTYRYYSPDNPVDGVVIRVLLEKAHEIRKTLGTSVPVPEESETLIEALVNAMFLSRRPSPQLTLELDAPAVQRLTLQMQRDAERERTNRTRFAQRALKPDQIKDELDAVDQVLGDPNLVQHFVTETLKRLVIPLKPDPRVPDRWILEASLIDATPNLPAVIRNALPTLPRGQKRWYFSFVSPTPEGAIYLGRNHPFVQTLAHYLFELSFGAASNALVSRCGAIATDAVARPTALYLLRQRYLLHQPNRAPQLAEECRLLAVDLDDPSHAMGHEQALALFEKATPSTNLERDAKIRWLQHALELWRNGTARAHYQTHIQQRLHTLTESHRRLRQTLLQSHQQLQLESQNPPDLIGILTLIPHTEARP